MSTELLNRERLASRSGGVWDYVSPSRLNTWLACPLKFKLKYLDGMPTRASPAMLVGKAVHAGLECFYRHRQLGITQRSDEVIRRMEDAWDPLVQGESQAFKSAADEQTCRRQAADLVQAYLDQAPADEPVPSAVEVAAEAPLVDPMTGENLGIPLVGIMDLVLPEAQGPVIVDFKTTSRSAEPLEISHGIQLSCYAYLFRHASGIQERSLEIRNLVKTKVPKVQLERYGTRTEKHFRRLFDVIRAYLDDLDTRRFVFRPGLGCSMCVFRQGCCQD